MDELVMLSVTLAGVLIAGMVACLPLYKWKIGRLVRSELFVKIAMWIPIYFIFLAVVVCGVWLAVAVVVSIGVVAAFEYTRAVRRKGATFRAGVYFVCFYVFLLVAASLIGQFGDRYIALMTMIFVSSVLSDVFAFFCGNYIGRHKLPHSINDHKSWEGVAGQFAGGVAGACLAGAIIPIGDPLVIGLIVGGASAVGDVLNSIAKRSLGIKDWAKTIPGHGGMLDRCSSLMAAFATISLLVALGALLD